MTGLLQPLLTPSFRKYFGAATLSALGDGMHLVALSWYVYHLTGTVASVGGILMAQTLPGLVLAPTAGVLVDRWNVRRICIITDILQALVVFGLVLAIRADRWVLLAVYIASFLLAVCRLFSSPAMGALVRDITQPEALLSANILSSTTLQMGMLCGASMGGFLLEATGAAGVLVVDGATFLLSAVLTSWIRPVPHAGLPAEAGESPPKGLRGMRTEWQEAMCYAKQHRFIFWLATVDVFDTLAINAFNMLLPAFVSEVLRGGPKDFGLVEASWGAGALLGGFLLAFVVRHVSQHAISVAGPACLALLIGLFVTAQDTKHAMAAYFLLGLFVCAVGINTRNLLVSGVAPAHFGKIRSFVHLATAYASVVVFGVLSLLGDRLSPRWILASIGVVILTGFLGKLVQVLRHRI